VLTFTDEGREKFKEATKDAANRDDGDNYIAIVMDDEVVSSPTVDSSKYASTGIDSDSAIISMGSGDSEDAIYLASIIAAGQMPFNLECVKLEAVGASLGEKSLETSLLAGAIGILLVMLFMIIMYRVPGLISCIALALYVALFCVVMSVAKLNLSLPGIAGIILTIGMAVDANVVIYERLKEELKSGKTLRSSIDAGYKRAVTAIVDSNITTIIAAAVLWWQGTGTILGFAKTLLIGVVLSMIVMLFVTKFLLKTFVGLKITNVKAYGA
jgi:protein-export membrane protein SecD